MTTSTIPVISVESSQISDIGFSPETGDIAVFFKQGNGRSKPYHYPGHTQAEFDAFRSAKSLGRWFGENLKPTAFVKIIETDDERSARKQLEAQAA